MRHHHHPSLFSHDGFSMHALWHAIGRGGHHDSRGGGRFGGGMGDFGGNDDAMPRGRKFSSEDLQLLILALLADEPRHGYELIKALEVRSNGFYSPSPGMIYPALTYLEELGYATVELEGNRKRYALAEPGRVYLEANRARVDLMFAKLTHFARKMDSVRRAFAGGDSADANEEDRNDGSTPWLPEFLKARMAMKHALFARSDASPDEQKRIAAILLRAIAEIENPPTSQPE